MSLKGCFCLIALFLSLHAHAEDKKDPFFVRLDSYPPLRQQSFLSQRLRFILARDLVEPLDFRKTFKTYIQRMQDTSEFYDFLNSISRHLDDNKVWPIVADSILENCDKLSCHKNLEKITRGRMRDFSGKFTNLYLSTKFNLETFRPEFADNKLYDEILLSAASEGSLAPIRSLYLSSVLGRFQTGDRIIAKFRERLLANQEFKSFQCRHQYHSGEMKKALDCYSSLKSQWGNLFKVLAQNKISPSPNFEEAIGKAIEGIEKSEGKKSLSSRLYRAGALQKLSAGDADFFQKEILYKRDHNAFILLFMNKKFNFLTSEMASQQMDRLSKSKHPFFKTLVKKADPSKDLEKYFGRHSYLTTVTSIK